MSLTLINFEISISYHLAPSPQKVKKPCKFHCNNKKLLLQYHNKSSISTSIFFSKYVCLSWINFWNRRSVSQSMCSRLCGWAKKTMSETVCSVVVSRERDDNIKRFKGFINTCYCSWANMVNESCWYRMGFLPELWLKQYLQQNICPFNIWIWL